jgi:hypothetical protein
MVPQDLLALAQEAGGVERLRDWFRGRFDPATADEEWEAYLSGQYVCLHEVRPATIKRKDAVVAAIAELLARPRPGCGRLEYRAARLGRRARRA